MKTLLVIPARYHSTRLPGKPLKIIAGKTLIERVWKIAKSVKNVSDVVVATDDQRIKEEVSKFGGNAIMTPSTCKNGSERAWETIKLLNCEYDAVINLQGDAPLTPPWVIDSLIQALECSDCPDFVTPAVSISKEQYDQYVKLRNAGSTTGTYVVVDKHSNALYFSRYVIPFLRSVDSPTSVALKHLGIYGYRLKALQEYLNFEPGRLEEVEGLEQLRILENGKKIKVVPVDLKGRTQWSVDNPEDIERVEKIIAQEGELIA